MIHRVLHSVGVALAARDGQRSRAKEETYAESLAVGELAADGDPEGGELSVQDLVACIRNLCARRRVTVVGVDGRSAAARDKVAAALASVLDGVVVTADDFKGRSRSDQAVSPSDFVRDFYDWARLQREALLRLRAGAPTSFRYYDWEARRLTTTMKTLEPARLVLLEGLFSSAPVLANLVDARVIVEGPSLSSAVGLGAVSGRSTMELWRLAEDWFFSSVSPPVSFDFRVRLSGAADEFALA